MRTERNGREDLQQTYYATEDHADSERAKEESNLLDARKKGALKARQSNKNRKNQT